MTARTLLDLAGATQPAIDWTTSPLVLIDYQNEYLSGPIALPEADAAVSVASQALAAARDAGARVIHVAHAGAPDGMFDRTGERGAFIAALAPLASETVIEKRFPNAFAQTTLAEALGTLSAPVVLMGFMTHMCVSSTARAALDLGYRCVVIGDACATRDLPTEDGTIAAADLHRAELAAIADRFAWIVPAGTVTSPT